MKRLSRRAWAEGLSAFGASLFLARQARGFGEAGAFNPRLLRAGHAPSLAWHESAVSRWSWELVRRTSAPARLVPSHVGADDPELYGEPFTIWAGDQDVGTLRNAELRGLSRFFSLGGVLLVDDSEPEKQSFGRSVRREIARVISDSPSVVLPDSHVLFKTFYIIQRPVGRLAGPGVVEAVVRGKNAQVLYLGADLLGALAYADNGFMFPVEPGGIEQREHAARLAVNIAMYVLCSDYKDDQVHAPWLMRRRAGLRH